MTKEKDPREIRITKNGPYIVTGGIPLLEKNIVPKGKEYIYEEGGVLPQGETYSLCRCGKTKTPPFCDGSHSEVGFCGEEKASKASYEDRSKCLEGPTIDLMDDHRCALARFCHRKSGDAWELTLGSDLEGNRSEVITAANECPAGRITAVTKEGEIIEPELPQEIIILQDVERNTSSGIYVQGYIPIRSVDGDHYEKRNRVVLCRCGKSSITPFCDAKHIKAKFRDWEKEKEEKTPQD